VGGEILAQRQANTKRRATTLVLEGFGSSGTSFLGPEDKSGREKAETAWHVYGGRLKVPGKQKEEHTNLKKEE